MPALDTNVLVRYIVQDEPSPANVALPLCLIPSGDGRLRLAQGRSQLAAAKRLISRCVTGGWTLFVPVTVVLELEWVLRSSIAFGKDEVLMTLSNLLSADELALESERALEVALQLYRTGSADFADRLHVALAAQAGEQPLWTFDKGAAKVNGARLLAKA